MRFESINQWLTLTANVGVVIGIAFLAIEIQQNTNMMQAQVAQSRFESAVAVSEAEYTSDYLTTIKEALENGAEVTPIEERSYVSWLRTYLRSQDSLFQQSELGLTEDYVLRAMERGVRFNLESNNLAMNYWQQSQLNFSDGFIGFVNEILQKN